LKKLFRYLRFWLEIGFSLQQILLKNILFDELDLKKKTSDAMTNKIRACYESRHIKMSRSFKWPPACHLTFALLCTNELLCGKAQMGHSKFTT